MALTVKGIYQHSKEYLEDLHVLMALTEYALNTRPAMIRRKIFWFIKLLQKVLHKRISAILSTIVALNLASGTCG